MRASRRLSVSAHGAIESLCGMAIMLSPLVLGVGAAGLVVLGAIGAIVTGTGLGLISTAPRAGALPSRRDSVRAHTGLDGLLVVASALGALGLALAGEAPAALALTALVAVQAALSFTTSYATAS
ncbi:MAG TPA: hypothetical protein VGH24_08965 [Solirubrobacteraceae bacterium]